MGVPAEEIQKELETDDNLNNDLEGQAAGGEEGAAGENDGGEGEQGGKPERVTFSQEQQRVFDTVIGEKTKKQKEAEREAERLKQENEALKAKVPQRTRPDIPPIPDSFAENYEQLVRERDDAIKAAAEYDAQVKIENEQTEAERKIAEEKAQEELINIVKTYSDRAEKLGVKADKLQEAGSKIDEHGLHDAVVAYILSQEQGPVITKYLADNILELDKVSRLSPLDAAVYITSQIQPKAVEANKISDLPPDPSDTLSGPGVQEGERGPKGATYE